MSPSPIRARSVKKKRVPTGLQGSIESVWHTLDNMLQAHIEIVIVWEKRHIRLEVL